MWQHLCHKLDNVVRRDPGPRNGGEWRLLEGQQSRAQAIQMSGVHLLADTGGQGASEGRHTIRPHMYEQGRMDQGCDGQEVQVLEM